MLLRNGCFSQNEITPQMCRYSDTILGMKLLINFRYDMLWEVSNKKCLTSAVIQFIPYGGTSM